MSLATRKSSSAAAHSLPLIPESADESLLLLSLSARPQIAPRFPIVSKQLTTTRLTVCVHEFQTTFSSHLPDETIYQNRILLLSHLLEPADRNEANCDRNVLPPTAGPVTSTATPKDQTESQVVERRSTSAVSVPKSTTGSPI